MKLHTPPAEVTIRKATRADFAEVMALFDGARHFMRASGNCSQWTGDYPSPKDISQDIDLGQLYIITGNIADNDTRILLVFALVPGEDPHYGHIISGRWEDDTLPYSTIHRMASSGLVPHLSDLAFAFCSMSCDNLRVDTHADNHTMLSAIKRAGFKKCGIVFMDDGSERIAFQKLDIKRNNNKTQLLTHQPIHS